MDSLQIKLSTLEIQNKELNTDLKIKKSYLDILEKKCNDDKISNEHPINYHNSESNSSNYQEKKTIEILETRIQHLEEVIIIWTSFLL